MRIPLTVEKKSELLECLENCRNLQEVPPANSQCDCEECLNYWRPEKELDQFLSKLNKISGVCSMTSKMAKHENENSYIQIALDRVKYDRLTHVNVERTLCAPGDRIKVVRQLGGEPDEAPQPFHKKTGLQIIDDPKGYTSVDRIFIFYLSRSLEGHRKFFRKVLRMFERM